MSVAERSSFLIPGRAVMPDLSRRDLLAMAAVPVMLQAGNAAQRTTNPRSSGAMFVCMHEASSEGFDFKTAMEGYAKAGIRAVEPNLLKVKEFADKENSCGTEHDWHIRKQGDSALAGAAERVRCAANPEQFVHVMLDA